MYNFFWKSIQTGRNIVAVESFRLPTSGYTLFFSFALLLLFSFLFEIFLKFFVLVFCCILNRKIDYEMEYKGKLVRNELIIHDSGRHPWPEDKSQSLKNYY